jgi:hypothetical protein
MKINSWALTVTWDDGTSYDVSHRIPMRLGADLENFIDHVEEQDNDEDTEHSEDCPAIDGFGCNCKEDEE